MCGKDDDDDSFESLSFILLPQLLLPIVSKCDRKNN
jgi:hypothetical protein